MKKVILLVMVVGLLAGCNPQCAEFHERVNQYMTTNNTIIGKNEEIDRVQLDILKMLNKRILALEAKEKI